MNHSKREYIWIQKLSRKHNPTWSFKQRCGLVNQRNHQNWHWEFQGQCRLSCKVHTTLLIHFNPPHSNPPPPHLTLQFLQNAMCPLSPAAGTWQGSWKGEKHAWDSRCQEECQHPITTEHCIHITPWSLPFPPRITQLTHKWKHTPGNHLGHNNAGRRTEHVLKRVTTLWCRQGTTPGQQQCREDRMDFEMSDNATMRHLKGVGSLGGQHLAVPSIQAPCHFYENH